MCDISVARRNVPEGIRVLVVDDEPGLAELVGLWLEASGCEIATARSAIEALDNLARGVFDVLFTDVSMPGGMDGFELAAEAIRRWPALKVAFGSAHAWQSPDGAALSATILRKPYTQAQVQCAVVKVLTH